MNTPPLARVAGVGVVVGLATALAASAFGSPRLRDALIAAAPSCPFLTLTGIPCPFCGLTRATVALGSGDFTAAFTYHPLAPLILALTLWGALLLALGRLPSLASRRVAIAGAIAILALWIAALAAPGG